MHHLTFDCASVGGTERRSLPVRDLVIGGWTGRDPRKVEEHIEELAALGRRVTEDYRKIRTWEAPRPYSKSPEAWRL